jgi:hypothetical protein
MWRRCLNILSNPEGKERQVRMSLSGTLFVQHAQDPGLISALLGKKSRRKQRFLLRTNHPFEF